MSHVLNDAADFADEAADGFVAAHPGLVRRVRGGVARASATPDGQVAVVIGGGSGHYPAFAGLVGPGIAHAAAMGNVFASPSAQQVHAVAKAVATDAGVLLTYGNYAGDALNFDQAQEQLRAEGIACETVRVTDDIYSAGPDEREKRRGIAGDLTVFRVAGWAAEQGRDLDAVTALASRANERTRSIGVAFSGCTLPGADEPLFTVPAGHMAVGMGIHGEPGIETLRLPSAAELATMLVERLLGERPDHAGDRVAVIVNGLGSVKSEELFVLYGGIAAALTAAGLHIVDPEVGEFATSFEMAGVSLTLMWLDDELERAWQAPAYTPAYRKGVVVLDAERTTADADALDDEETIAEAGPEAAAAGRAAASALSAVRAVIDREADELGRLDAIAGDGDHGIGMQRGARAADTAAGEAAGAGAGIGTVLTRAGDAWADKAGGTSGALWGMGLRAIGERLGDAAAPDPRAVVAAVAAARDAVQGFGKAQVGDKTLVDALVPFAATLAERVDAGAGLADAWRDAAAAATAAAQATADLLPRMGRARPHTEKSLGTPDPGAVSLALAATAVAAALDEHRGQKEKEN
ncbi:dihydroxyacetone kinase family protein [Microbacterium horticulturae]|uniref:Dihydroxyacetone kinase family protein n=1 Tax=Microbacterium horticulturae TaxID=3028316 RepID=A0ABY8C213_9MICO|nr:dihydroxyacetone kinase family protein [Microbacterium sp. KACC 23027]WEG09285.1 dihydroxyacetone kinase family protein [Microbacterium sp. KACC 23027]